jgi:hypothetical protein
LVDGAGYRKPLKAGADALARCVLDVDQHVC